MEKSNPNKFKTIGRRCPFLFGKWAVCLFGKIPLRKGVLL
jgi:hypothetical protein